MRKMSHVKLSIITSVCMALCVVLPLLFHAIPGAGRIFLPMHFPVLLCGLVCGFRFGLLCGIGGPLLSGLLTGMPPAAMLPSLVVELSAYGVVSGVLMQWVHTRRLYVDLYISLVCAMLLGRVLAGISRALIFAEGGYSMGLWVAGFFVTSLPGMLLQLALLPSIVFALEAARLIPRKYPVRVGH